MVRVHHKPNKDLAHMFPPSAPCDCAVCRAFCRRPGWWSVEEAGRALEAGYGGRMMLEVAPEHTFGVLAPAFKGCEGGFALQPYAERGCTFFEDGRCALHGTGFQPLECRFCHHERAGQGPLCHAALEAGWHTPQGQALVIRWCKLIGLWPQLKAAGLHFQLE